MLLPVGFVVASLFLPTFGAVSHRNFVGGHEHRALAHRASGDIGLHRRFDNTRFTFYDVGLGACGKYNVPSDFIVALNTPQFGGGYPGPNCFKSITINYGGNSAQATIMDECPGCPFGGLDMSRGLFDHFASESVGVLYGSWFFNDGSGGGGNNAPPPPATHTHTATHTTHSSTPEWTPEAKTTYTTPDYTPPATTDKPSSTPTKDPASSLSKSSSASENIKPSTSAATPTETPSTDALNALNQVIMGMGGIVSAGGNVSQ